MCMRRLIVGACSKECAGPACISKRCARGTRSSRSVWGDDDAAWAMIAQLVGAIHIARAMPDEAMQRMIVEASKRFLQDAGTRLAAKS